MTGSGEVWLAVIAIAVALMAAAQIVLAVVAARALRQATETILQVKRDVQPVLENARKISGEAARAALLASSQMQRIDEMLASTAVRIDHTLGLVQGVVVGPVRQGAAALAAFRAALSVFRGLAGRRRAARDEEEALFVG
ncbi:MAG TPA: hypothetical protein VMM93_14540 [Vicinamibacterales bacterium]|nr:hypothetical protein [Vicinamibacterales bacterium]